MKHPVLKTFSILLSLVAASTASASTNEIWKGEGKLYGLNRDLVSTYNVEVHIETNSESEKQVEVQIHDQKGNTIQTNVCNMKSQDLTWIKNCDNGTSRGAMFEHGLGIDYFETSQGKSFATNIVMDSDSRMRLFRVEMLNGKATRFFVEVLNKISD